MVIKISNCSKCKAIFPGYMAKCPQCNYPNNKIFRGTFGVNGHLTSASKLTPFNRAKLNYQRWNNVYRNMDSFIEKFRAVDTGKSPDAIRKIVEKNRNKATDEFLSESKKLSRIKMPLQKKVTIGEYHQELPRRPLRDWFGKLEIGDQTRLCPTIEGIYIMVCPPPGCSAPGIKYQIVPD